MWNLTEHTVDAAPDGFIVNIENHPMSPVNVDPADRQLVIHTEPGGVYVITITAINVDSQTVSQPAHLILPDRGISQNHGLANQWLTCGLVLQLHL